MFCVAPPWFAAMEEVIHVAVLLADFVFTVCKCNDCHIVFQVSIDTCLIADCFPLDKE